MLWSRKVIASPCATATAVAGLACALAATPSPQASGQPPPALRLHGIVEPVHSHPVAAPRLTGAAPGSAPGQLVVVRLARAGTLVAKGDLLVEFDRRAQLKAARDREAEHHDIAAQIEKKRAEQDIARADRRLARALAENAVTRAELDVLGNEMLANITAEKNVQALEEARAHLAALDKTMAMKERAEAADLRMLDVQKARALSAWQHATRNAERMRISSPLDGLVVLKAIWKSGTMAEVQEGEEVRAGIPILEVVNPAVMRIRALVNQADVTYLQPGQRARITLDSHPSRQFEGRLEHLSPVAMTSALSTRVRTCLAIFSIEGRDDHLLPDLAAAVDVLLDEPPAATGDRR